MPLCFFTSYNISVNKIDIFAMKKEKKSRMFIYNSEIVATFFATNARMFVS
jgi:hypothetical protein